jgi:hypothetical protein
VEREGELDLEDATESVEPQIDPVLDVLGSQVREDPQTSTGVPLLDDVLDDDDDDDDEYEDD